MSTESKALRLETEVKEELEQMISGFDGTTNDFMKTLLEIYKTNKIIDKTSSSEADLKELNILTSRIYSIYNNIIERNNTGVDALQQEFSDRLQAKETEISELKAKSKEEVEALKQKLEDLKLENSELKADCSNVGAERNKIEKENQQLVELNNSYKLNISKQEEEIVRLQEVNTVNKKLTEKIEATQALLTDSQSKIFELEDKRKKLESEKENLNKLNSTLSKEAVALKNEHNNKIDILNKQHKNETENLRKSIEDKKDFEKEKALMDQEKEFNNKIQALKEEFNKKLETAADHHQTKVETLQNKIQELIEKQGQPKAETEPKKNTK